RPGAIVASMLFVQRIHNGARVAASRLALCAVIVVLWLAMRFCGLVQRVPRDSGMELLSRISGLLLSAIAVPWSRFRGRGRGPGARETRMRKEGGPWRRG
ncbi:MAG: MarC family protein, partial [Streptosporangiaceae bacterium]